MKGRKNIEKYFRSAEEFEKLYPNKKEQEQALKREEESAKERRKMMERQGRWMREEEKRGKAERRKEVPEIKKEMLQGVASYIADLKERSHKEMIESPGDKRREKKYKSVAEAEKNFLKGKATFELIELLRDPWLRWEKSAENREERLRKLKEGEISEEEVRRLQKESTGREKEEEKELSQWAATLETLRGTKIKIGKEEIKEALSGQKMGETTDELKEAREEAEEAFEENKEGEEGGEKEVK